MPRAYTSESAFGRGAANARPYLGHSKKAAHEKLLQLRKANMEYVMKGYATAIKYKVVKLKKGYVIYYKKTGRWRGDLRRRRK